MSILSITFHAVPQSVEKWDRYTESTLVDLAENLMDIESYILSDVQSEMTGEGKNTSLLLFFEDEGKRAEFLESEFVNIQERVAGAFGDDVMIFETFLNPKKTRR